MEDLAFWVSVLWLPSLVILVVLLIPFEWDPAMRLKAKQERERDLRRLALDGYKLDEKGLTVCSSCGAYCGQCSNGSRIGITLELYRKKFW